MPVGNCGVRKLHVTCPQIARLLAANAVAVLCPFFEHKHLLRSCSNSRRQLEMQVGHRKWKSKIWTYHERKQQNATKAVLDRKPANLLCYNGSDDAGRRDHYYGYASAQRRPILSIAWQYRTTVKPETILLYRSSPVYFIRWTLFLFHCA